MLYETVPDSSVTVSSAPPTGTGTKHGMHWNKCLVTLDYVTNTNVTPTRTSQDTVVR